VFVGAGFFSEDAASDGTIAYSDFEIWSLAGIALEAILAPSIEMDAASFTGFVTGAVGASPLAGPTSGDLVQATGSATVMPAGVELEDFVARATFVNPGDAGDSPWDFGIAFREQDNGDHYRLTISSDGSWELQIGLQSPLAEGNLSSLSFEQSDLNTLEVAVIGGSAGFSVNDTFVADLDVSSLSGPGDVWIGAGFHQANVVDGVVTRFRDFAVWAIEPAVESPTPTAATPVANVGVAPQQVALRLDERDNSGVDALAVLEASDGGTTVTVTARDASGAEVVVVHEGTCEETATLPAFLLEDLDASGRSETTIEAPISDLLDGAHSIAIHRSADDYADVLACGDIRAAE